MVKTRIEDFIRKVANKYRKQIEEIIGEKGHYELNYYNKMIITKISGLLYNLKSSYGPGEHKSFIPNLNIKPGSTDLEKLGWVKLKNTNGLSLYQVTYSGKNIIKEYTESFND